MDEKRLVDGTTALAEKQSRVIKIEPAERPQNVRLSKQKAPSTFSENMAVAREGGEAAGIARKAVEERTGVPVITPKNAAQLNQVVTDLLEGAVSDTKEKPKDK